MILLCHELTVNVINQIIFKSYTTLKRRIGACRRPQRACYCFKSTESRKQPPKMTFNKINLHTNFMTIFRFGSFIVPAVIEPNQGSIREDTA